MSPVVVIRVTQTHLTMYSQFQSCLGQRNAARKPIIRHSFESGCGTVVSLICYRWNYCKFWVILCVYCKSVIRKRTVSQKSGYDL